MRKNKKILLTIITLLVSTLLFINNANAGAVMYMECQYGTDTEKDKYSDYNYYFTINGKYGPYPVVIDDESNVNFNDRECWLESSQFLNESCKTEYNVSNTGQFSEGICPADIRKDRVNKHHFVPAGEKTPVDISNIEKDELVFYKINEVGQTPIIIGLSYDTSGNFNFVSTVNLKNNKEDLAGNKCIFTSRRTEIFGCTSYDLRAASSKYFNYNPDDPTAAVQVATIMNAAGCDRISENCKFTGVPEYYKLTTLGKNVFASEIRDKVEIIFDSRLDYDSNNDSDEDKEAVKKNSAYFQSKIEKWLEDPEIKQVITNQKETRDKIDDGNWLETAQDFNEKSSKGGSYIFTTSNSREKFLGELITVYPLIKESLGDKEDQYIPTILVNNHDENGRTLSKIDAFSSFLIKDITEGIVTKKLDDREDNFFVGLVEFYTGSSNASSMDGILTKMIEKELNKNSDFKTLSDDEVKERLSQAMQAISYLQYYKNDYTMNLKDLYNYVDESTIKEILDGKFDGSLNSVLDGMRELYEELGKKYGIYSITDCTGLLGQRTINKIKPYINAVKIAVPILLILFGIIDFSKAIFAGDQEKMATAQKTFIKRLAIAILVFVVPTLLGVLLKLANEVWPFIIPDTCGF